MLLPKLFAGVILSISLPACIQSGKPLPSGGELPTNYVIVKDSSFSPANLSVVSGSSITFVNNTATLHTIVSMDSVAILPTKIESGKSFSYKKDIVGTIQYKCLLHPQATGSITLLP